MCIRDRNNNDPEPALQWLMQHMDDSDFQDEFVPPPQTKAAGPAAKVDQESLSNMIDMGLNEKLSIKALVLNKGDINASIEWVFNNPDDNGELPSETTPKRDEEGIIYGNLDAKPYRLTAVVCHKGNSAHSGHYVAFIRKMIDDELKWVLYNDEKIVVSDNIDEIKKDGYIYFYSRD